MSNFGRAGKAHATASHLRMAVVSALHGRGQRRGFPQPHKGGCCGLLAVAPADARRQSHRLLQSRKGNGLLPARKSLHSKTTYTIPALIMSGPADTPCTSHTGVLLPLALLLSPLSARRKEQVGGQPCLRGERSLYLSSRGRQRKVLPLLNLNRACKGALAILHLQRLPALQDLGKQMLTEATSCNIPAQTAENHHPALCMPVLSVTAACLS